MRADSVDEDELEVADEQIQRAFDARARLESVDLLTARLIPAPEMVVEEEDVALEGGTQPVVEASSLATDVIVELDGTTTLAEMIASVAETREVPAEKLEREVLEVVRELLELGFDGSARTAAESSSNGRAEPPPRATIARAVTRW